MNPELDLEISRFMKAPRAKVWRCWADPEILKTWWCPKPWVTQVKAFDFRPGGAFHTFMTGPLPDGAQGESDNPGCFLAVDPMERIVATSVLGANWRPIESWMPMTAIYSFADEAGGTRLTARAMHLTAASRDKHLEMGFNDGWGTMLAQLDAASAALA